jgi:hypothetical protein
MAPGSFMTPMAIYIVGQGIIMGRLSGLWKPIILLAANFFTRALIRKAVDVDYGKTIPQMATLSVKVNGSLEVGQGLIKNKVFFLKITAYD